jgi:hypothetical protein
MNDHWDKAGLRFDGGGPLFGYMHEDADCEVSCLPPSGRAACVLSAGDVAFALAKAGADHVLAADPSPAQIAWVRCKQQIAKQNLTPKDLLNHNVTEALAHFPKAAAATKSARWHRRPLLAAGEIDHHLRLIARWINPWILGRANDHQDWSRTLNRAGWQLAWQALACGVALAFPFWYRRHLPADFIRRLRHRFETTVQRADQENNHVLQRMLAAHPATCPDAWEPTWPTPDAATMTSIELRQGKLEDQAQSGCYDLFALSNILDTQPPPALTSLLTALRPQANPGAIVVLRSLFRDLPDWPEPPPGWTLDKPKTQTLQALDKSPLCQISAVYRLDPNRPISIV